MFRFASRCLLGLLAITFVASSFAHKVANPEKYITQSLSVSGLVKNHLRLSIDELKGLPRQAMENVPIISKHGTTVIKSLKGVLLKDLLDKAEIVSKAPGDTKRMYIVATASDNYKAIFSWNEVFNSPLGSGIVVAYEKDETEIGDAEGRLLLVSAKDFMTGARHVRWLKDIDVRKISD